MNWTWTALGVVLSVIGALVLGVQSTVSQHNAERESAENKKAQQDLRAAQDENVRLAKETVRLSTELTAQVTGGDSYVWLDLVGVGGLFVLRALHEGNYPVSNVQVWWQELVPHMSIEEMDRIGKQPGGSLKLMATTTPSVTLGTFIPNTVSYAVGGRAWETSVDHRHIRLGVSASNGQIFEQISLRKIDGKWFKARKVQRPHGDDLVDLKESHIDDGFPMKGAEPDW